MCLSIMMVTCINQHLSNIWSSIHEKVKQKWSWVEKKALFIKKACMSRRWDDKFPWSRYNFYIWWFKNHAPPEFIFICFDEDAQFFFCSIWVIFYEHSQFTGQQEKGDAICLTPLCHFHPLHKHLDISQTITAEISPLHIASSQTRAEPLFSEREWLSTKLCGLELNYNVN